MNKPPIQVGLSEDKKKATVAWSGPAELDVVQLSLLIEALGIVRSNLLPAVPEALPAGSRVYPLSGVYWEPTATGARATEAGAVFLARSPHFGWFDCPMSAEFCQHLLVWLQGEGAALSAPVGTTVQ